ncbi:unnamed protein product [Caenorhabditis auriculariae]|uniref:Kazal-like domain-containing protein n=1 Tax=Caenorhabditis auriculariae TaxID=2777116 RepID=A0A8S1H5S2_9PELO|nr:unnamed protein product [Caenorhabditis auriculariae]
MFACAGWKCAALLLSLSPNTVMSQVALLLCLIIGHFASATSALNLTQLTGGCKCKPKLEPVCVREGLYQYTYSNKCVYKCVQSRKDVALLYEGACCAAKHCGMFESPVCSESGQMFKSICDFEEVQCVEHRKFKKHLVMDTTHEKCSCILPCPQEWNPVCDSKGKTHANFCTFLNSKCYHKQQLNQSLEVDYSGTCCDDICSVGFSSLTVCDSDGNTHTDLCSFYVEQCRQKRRGSSKVLKIAGVGSCKPKHPLFRTFDYFVNRFPNYHSPIFFSDIN